MTNEELLKQIAQLAIATAEELAPLVRATQPHNGPLGGPPVRPTATERAVLLQSRATALRQLFGIDHPAPLE